MLIDDVQITVSSGHGGNGAVAFNRTKMSLGPTGGSGGKGGDVFAEGVMDLGALRQFRYKKELQAGHGENGRPQFVDGKAGADLVIQVPLGTVIHELTTNKKYEIVAIGERFLLVGGGRGGRGNFHFRSSTNTSPKEFEKGTSGSTHALHLELKLIADLGLIGFPNAGKSSLLNALTKARAKVGAYPFTTLEPNLGDYYGLIIADIPGLIEGASSGKGLGVRFLRHIERTKTLFHLVSAESADPVADYKTVRQELSAYKPELLERPEYVFLSKVDVLTSKEAEEKLKTLRRVAPQAVSFSIYDDESLKKIEVLLRELLRAKTSPQEESENV